MVQTSFLTAEAKPKMEEVDMKEWVHRLKMLADSAESDPTISSLTIPGLRLLHFFESMCDAEDGQVISKVFETDKTTAVSQALRECGGMRSEWIEMNVQRWREIGFFGLR